jgi:hypothetical protein
MRYIGIMNPGTANTAVPAASRVLEGAGNSRAMMGTGNIWYTQAGFLLPKTLSKKLRVQPIAAFAMKDFEALNESGSYFDAGANFFIDGHHSKVTFQYSSRPNYSSVTRNLTGERKGEFLVQFQIFL